MKKEKSYLWVRAWCVVLLFSLVCVFSLKAFAQEHAVTNSESMSDVSAAVTEPSVSQVAASPSPPDSPSTEHATQAPPSDKPVVSDGNGELISVNFENVDIHDVIRILAEKAQLNMVVGPEVAATVNLQLNNVSWEKALKVILMTYNLTYKRDGDMIRIMTLDQLQAEDEKVPLATKIITLNFARAAEVKSNFQNMLSSRGRIDINDRTNSLIVTDIPDNITRIEEIANKLDTRTPQVMIEALMADVVVTQDDQLGVDWTLKWPDDRPNQKRIFHTVPGPLASTGEIISFGTTILSDVDINATIAAWQQQSRVNILAHPKILTLDNLAAKINLTEEIPYQQQTTSTASSSAVVSTSFKEAGINLTVTPHITTKDNFIYLNIDVKQSFRSGFTADKQPIIDSRSAATNLLVRDRQTAVIGGLRRKNDTFAVSKVPILGDIPMIGSIFRNRTGAVSDTDLMIFVTPTIVEQTAFSPKEEDRLRLFQEETDDWNTQFDRLRHEKLKQAKAHSMETVPQHTVTPQSEYNQGEGSIGYFYLRPPSTIQK